MLRGIFTRRSMLGALAIGAMLGLSSLLTGCASHGAHGEKDCCCKNGHQCKNDAACCKSGKCGQGDACSKAGCCEAGKGCCAS